METKADILTQRFLFIRLLSYLHIIRDEIPAIGFFSPIILTDAVFLSHPLFIWNTASASQLFHCSDG